MVNHHNLNISSEYQLVVKAEDLHHLKLLKGRKEERRARYSGSWPILNNFQNKGRGRLAAFDFFLMEDGFVDSLYITKLEIVALGSF